MKTRIFFLLFVTVFSGFSAERLARKQPSVSTEDKWRETPFVEKNPEPIFEREEKKRGFIVFHRPITEVVYPNSKPLDFEKINSISGFAARVEFEPLTFSIYPVRELKNLRVGITPLNNRESIIPVSNVDIRLVTYWNIRYPTYHYSCRTYRRMPELLEKVSIHTSPAGESQRYWITVKVPDDCPEGVYRGKVILSDEGYNEKTVIPVQFKVFGFKLKKDPNKHFSAYVYDLHRRLEWAKTETEKNFWKKAIANDYKAMSEFGIDSSPTLRINYDAEHDKLYLPADGRAIKELEKAGITGSVPILMGYAIAELYRKYTGTTGRPEWNKQPPDRFYSHLIRLIRQFEEKRRNNNWPEFIYCPIDEIDSDKTQFGVKIYKTVKEAGVRTFITKNPVLRGAEARSYDPYVDIWCMQPFSVDYKEALKSKKEYWSYPNQVVNAVRIPKVMARGGRMTYGFGFWKSGYAKLIPWIWRWEHKPVFKYNYLTTKRSSRSGNQIDESGEVIPSVYWNCFREGYDDTRYIYTLQDAIVKREKSSDANCVKQVKKSKKLLQQIWRDIDHQAEYLYDNSWSSLEFNAVRWKLALSIEKLLTYPPVDSTATAPSVFPEFYASTADQKKSGFLAEEEKKGNLELFPLWDNRFIWKNLTDEGQLDILQKKEQKIDRKCMRFKVKIDHKTDGGGEVGDYPIGWPRIRSVFKESEDFSGFDGFFMSIKVISNRDDAGDDFTFLAINGKSTSGVRVFDRQLLGTVPENSWIQVFIPFQELFSVENRRGGKKTADISYLKQMKSMQIYIGERLYSHGAEVEFYIDGPYLYRFKKAFIKRISFPQSILLSETKVLPVKIQLMGYKPGKNASVNLAVFNQQGEQKTLLSEKPEKSLLFFVPVSNFSPGTYTLKVSLDNDTCKEYKVDIMKGML